MKNNKKVITALLISMTAVLLGSTVYISSLLSASNSPTQIQKTKAAPISYSRTVNLANNFGTPDLSATPLPLPTGGLSGTPQISVLPTKILLATAPTLLPTALPTVSVKVTLAPTMSLPPTVPVSTLAPSAVPSPTPSPTMQPLLAYKSTTISPTLIPLANTGGMADPTKPPSPTVKKTQPTGVQQLPETGWIQTSSILFIVATSTILFSLLF